MVIATTRRLELRRMTIADAKGLYELTNDYESNRLTGEMRLSCIDEARMLIARYRDYQLHGYGRWSVYLRSTGQFIGFCGLKKESVEGEVDISFRILKQFWRNGYASEAAQAALHVAFYDFNLERIIARAKFSNHASHAIFAKLGMRKSHCFAKHSENWVQYHIDKESFVSEKELAECC